MGETGGRRVSFVRTGQYKRREQLSSGREEQHTGYPIGRKEGKEGHSTLYSLIPSWEGRDVAVSGCRSFISAFLGHAFWIFNNGFVFLILGPSEVFSEPFLYLYIVVTLGFTDA